MPTFRLTEDLPMPQDGVTWPAGDHVVDDGYWVGQLRAAGAEEIADTTPIITPIVNPDANPAVFSTADLAGGHINAFRARARELGVSAAGSRDAIAERIAAAEAELAANASSSGGDETTIDPHAPETVEAVGKLLGLEPDAVAALPVAEYDEAVAKLVAEAAGGAG